jgi:aminoglycoside 6'-N-acetyltransferase
MSGRRTAPKALLKNGRLRVRKLLDEDSHLLLEWLSNPVLLQFYEGRDRDIGPLEIRNMYLTKQGNPLTGCVVEWDGRPIGFTQFYRLDDGEKTRYRYPITERIYGMDQFIGDPTCWDKGIGTFLVKSMAAYLCRSMKADRVVMDPQADNARAIRCYEKSGFRKIRALPRHEMHEGSLKDCWLMEYTETTASA